MRHHVEMDVRELRWGCASDRGGGEIWLRIKARGEETGGRLLIVEATLPAGWPGPPWHVHRDTDLGLYVLEGELTVKVASRLRSFRRGECTPLPSGVPHGFANMTARRTTVLLLASPPHELEGLLAELAADMRTDDGRQPDPGRLAELAAGHGITVLGPPFVAAGTAVTTASPQ
jgi:mannose-6-phosphate isomerase-like protein (cupin superfamily)